MVLSGTLREFILADVFQLLTQQKITGKFHLTTTKEEGVVVFKKGIIVCAFKDSERFETKLGNFLMGVRNVSENRVKAILSAFKEDLHGLTNEIIAQSLMSIQEVSALSLSTIEDITCSMFLWNSGSYRFSSMRNVDKFIPGNCTIPIENIIMEAMRRVDEWNRMQGLMNNETIFVHTDKTPQIESKSDQNPISTPVEYIAAKINGISQVKNLIDSTPLTQYKVYESLYSLIQSNRITPIPEKITQSGGTAPEKRENKSHSNSLSTFFYAMIVFGFVLFIVLLSSFLFKGVLLSKATVSSDIIRSELPRAIAKENKSIAQKYFQTLGKSEAALSDDSLIQFRLISKKDLELLKD